MVADNVMEGQDAVDAALLVALVDEEISLAGIVMCSIADPE